jgi:predicted PurR-regulated permease PerM
VTTSTSHNSQSHSGTHNPWLLFGILVGGFWLLQDSVTPIISTLFIIFFGIYLLLWPVNALERVMIKSLNLLLGWAITTPDQQPAQPPTSDSSSMSQMPANLRGNINVGLYSSADNLLVQRWSLLLRGVAVSLVFFVFFTVVLLTIILLGPAALHQAKILANELPGYLMDASASILTWLNTQAQAYGTFPLANDMFANSENLQYQQATDWINQELSNWIASHTDTLQATLKDSAGNLWHVLTGTATGLVTTIIVLASIYYGLLHAPTIGEKLRYVVPHGYYREECCWLLDKLHDIMGGFIKGQVLLGIITGIYMGVVYVLFGVKYAIILGLMFAVVEVLPVIGTWLGIIPGLFIAWLSGGVWTVFGVWLCSYIYQTIKDNIVAPKVVGDVLGLHPLAILLAVFIAGKQFGILGVIAAMPVCALVWALWQRYIAPSSPAVATPEEAAT